jgi:hypothetical protein
VSTLMPHNFDASDSCRVSPTVGTLRRADCVLPPTHPDKVGECILGAAPLGARHRRSW